MVLGEFSSIQRGLLLQDRFGIHPFDEWNDSYEEQVHCPDRAVKNM